MRKDNLKMNEAGNKVGALIGAAGAASGSADEWKQKYEELKREYDSKKPMLGRIGDLSAKDREIAELKKKIGDLEKGGRRPSDALTPDERENLSPEFVSAAEKISTAATEGISEELKRMRMEREQEREEFMKVKETQFLQAVESKYPGFLAKINGGEWAAAWSSYLSNNQGSVVSAYQSFDIGSLSYHVDRFYREVLEVRPPDGRGNASVPDPVSLAGGKPGSVVSKDKVYSPEEYEALEAECAKLRRNGDFDGYRKLRDNLENILREGRVKDE